MLLLYVLVSLPSVNLILTGIPSLSVTMHPCNTSTDKHVSLKFLLTKYFIMNNHGHI